MPSASVRCTLKTPQIGDEDGMILARCTHRPTHRTKCCRKPKHRARHMLCTGQTPQSMPQATKLCVAPQPGRKKEGSPPELMALQLPCIAATNK
ncbi:hypothetical protein NDU88_000992 [Pleurodeles waltl]|uniref:Uncharacterized protein n=1 Tax=Pleurodeles waltl TaxID=8319 RepID=A0AAV7SYL3_PLEWA|nr:hypothetical protein NDU88_000992 [Pleurodeles waltl]